MDLSTLKPAAGSVTSGSFRKGRGDKTAGKGTKGQKARSGAPRIGFEGGQMPLYRRLPKRGFKNVGRAVIETINLSDLEKFGSEGWRKGSWQWRADKETECFSECVQRISEGKD